MIFYLFVNSFVSLAIGKLVPLFFPQWEDTTLYFLLSQIIPGYCIAFPLTWLMLSGCPQKRPEKNKFAFSNRVLFLACAYAALYIGNFIGQFISNFSSALLGRESGSVVGEMMRSMSPFNLLILTVILAPLFEELLFRKILIDRLLPYSERLAVFLSGLLFGLFHGNFQQFFYAFFVGCVFGYVYVKTGRIRHTILLHMMVNFTGSFIPLLFQRQSETQAALSASINPWEMVFSFYNLGLLALCVIGVVYFLSNRKKFTLSAEGERSLTLKSQYQLAFGNPGMILFLILCVFLFIASLFLY